MNYCYFPMEIFTRFYPEGNDINLKPGATIEPIITIWNKIGSATNKISFENINAIVKDIPQIPKNPLSVNDSVSNSTMACIKIEG
jgi:hypothetical protein